MKIRNYLDFLEDIKIIKILRVFIKYPTELTGRQISRHAKLNNKTTIKYLEKLADKSILLKKIVGTSYLYSLRNNYFSKNVIIPIIKQEQALYYEIINNINETFSSYCKAIIIYGSYLKKTENEYSDLDICFIIEEKNVNFEKILDEYIINMIDLYSLQLSPHILTVSEVNEKKDIEVIKEILNNGEWIFGTKAIFNHVS